MIPDLTRHDRWKLLTTRNIRLKEAWPWGRTIQRVLAAKELGPAPVRDFIVASDYGGEHKGATHIVYVYLVVATGLDSWSRRMARLRKCTLGARTMAYKSLSDGVRQAALPDFLSAAAELDGHLVAIAVDKRKKWLSTHPGTIAKFRSLMQLQCFWNARGFEGLMRKAHFVALLASVWAPPRANLMWITDQDEIVANDRRHDDALLIAGRLSSMYLDQPMGGFALNTTAQDDQHRHFEDLCGVADLAAGLLSDVRSRLSGQADWPIGNKSSLASDLPLKAAPLLNWYTDPDMCLRKTFITIDNIGAQYIVRELHTGFGPPVL